MEITKEMRKRLDKETLERLDKLNEAQGPILNPGVGTMTPPFSKEFKGFDSLYELMLWNLTPLEAIAMAISLECDSNNLLAIDPLINDVRLKLEKLRLTIEGWMQGELQGRLKGQPIKKA